MKKYLIALAIVAFAAAGAAQQDMAGPEESPVPDRPVNQATNQTNQSTGQSNQTTESAEDKAPSQKGRSPQFDARLKTAIQTLETLIKIAPSDSASQKLEEAVNILKDVQQNTDTKSLGQDNRSLEDQEQSNSKGSDSSERRQRPGKGKDPEKRSKGGPPGFVQQMLGGLF